VKLRPFRDAIHALLAEGCGTRRWSCATSRRRATRAATPPLPALARPPQVRV